MAIGRKKLRKLQYGKETTSGTAVATTMIWRGPVDGPEDIRKLTEVEEMIGVIGDTDRTYIAEASSAVTVPSVPLAFEYFPYLMAYSFGGPLTGSADGAGTGKVYATSVPTTTTPTIQTATLEVGDDFEVEQITYAVINHIEISGNMGEAVKVTSKWIGQPVVYKSAFSSVTYSTLNTLGAVDAIASNAKLYLDTANGGVYGTNLVSNNVIGFKVSIDVTYDPIYALGTGTTTDFTSPSNYGYPKWSSLVYTGHKITGDLIFLHDTPITGNMTGFTDSSGFGKVSWRRQLPKKMRLSILGSPLTTAGTSYTYRTLNCDLPIKHSKISALGDKGGADTYTFSWFSKVNLQNPTDAGTFTCVIDTTATLP